jgi:uncharacterized membrane protein YqjE
VDEPRSSEGVLDGLRKLGATLIDAVGTRAELALVEFHEQAEHRKALLILAVIGGVFLVMGLLLAAFFVVVIFWDTNRLAAIGAVTLLYLGIAATAFLRLRSKARTAPRPFEATLRELAADREALKEWREH